ncbi:hypothetical protein GCM10022199_00440 [Marihabitans asiaticum]|uniref:Methylamine utilization protein MauE n=1 Tax=Marihabitans asiaticum TaxID=415218 RepID=A0A560WG52_9MICO|nr:MauE/DoxX family redox-associated membrane protein [Marihabitans asiaticum]TWD16673.1 methylamine utilization protein MauE [Marihabitans asiaticum]
MPDAFVAAPIILAAVLALAAHAKWGRRDSLVSAIRQLRLPDALHAPVRQLPPVEAVLAVLLVITPSPPLLAAVAALTLALMLAYTAVVARGLRMTPRPSCGCFGAVGAPITVETLVRNIVLTLLAIAALAWALDDHTVPTTVRNGGVQAWALLLVLAAAAAVTRWVVLERTGQPRPAAPAPPTQAAPTQALPTEDDDEYLRQPIPPALLLGEGEPISLRHLASRRAQLLIILTCGCGDNARIVAERERWAEQMPQIDVRLVSTMTPERTEATFAGQGGWLYDHEGVATQALGAGGQVCAVLLGADGMLAGGPVSGPDEIRQFVREIQETLADVPVPTLTRGGEEIPVGSLAPAALVFVSEGCAACQPVKDNADEVARYLQGHGVTLALVYRSEPEDAPHAPELTFVDADGTVSATYGVGGTPAAVHIGTGGAPQSPIVVGADAVQDLLRSVAR